MSALTALFTLIDHEYTWAEGIKLNALRQAARQMCATSGVWRTQLAAVPLVNATREYALVPPADGEVIRVKQLLHDDREIFPVTIDDLNALAPDWRDETHDKPTRFYMPSDGTVGMYPLPDAAVTGSLYADVVLRPTLAATTIPDHIAKHEEILRHGALAWLFAMRTKAWFSADAAGYHQKLFTGKVNDLTAQTEGLRANRPRRVRGPQFGGSRGSRSLTR